MRELEEGAIRINHRPHRLQLMSSSITWPDVSSHLTPSHKQQSLLIFHETVPHQVSVITTINNLIQRQSMEYEQRLMSMGWSKTR
ncbi:hypothetical protein H5410_063741 [Solanum commersonii]|uniref:Uncharacterized protein n=1 Tax=Solanum commersonii TaxID=4109 RepID=A0A9J5WF58_SOLCO|nr:hypothetical protein H5410_063741 [Solanum commersonii]